MKFYTRIPQIKDKRVVNKFAFLPTRITDDLVIWLQTYREVQMYRHVGSLSIPQWDTLRKTLQPKEEVLL